MANQLPDLAEMFKKMLPSKPIDIFHLEEHTALISRDCDGCLEGIDIGDSCFVDSGAGSEEGQALIYCENCAEND